MYVRGRRCSAKATATDVMQCRLRPSFLASWAKCTTAVTKVTSYAVRRVFGERGEEWKRADGDRSTNTRYVPRATGEFEFQKRVMIVLLGNLSGLKKERKEKDATIAITNASGFLELSLRFLLITLITRGKFEFGWFK